METKQLPKSLHTVTVLVNVARGRFHGRDVRAEDVPYYVNGALEVLGYSGAEDVHKLVDKAVAILTREVQ